MRIRTNLKAGFDIATRQVPAGPIWDDQDASTKCPGVCGSQGMCADGNWITTVPGQASSCSCIY
jgi:hypothetical protein